MAIHIGPRTSIFAPFELCAMISDVKTSTYTKAQYDPFSGVMQILTEDGDDAIVKTDFWGYRRVLASNGFEVGKILGDIFRSSWQIVTNNGTALIRKERKPVEFMVEGEKEKRIIFCTKSKTNEPLFIDARLMLVFAASIWFPKLYDISIG